MSNKSTWTLWLFLAFGLNGCGTGIRDASEISTYSISGTIIGLAGEGLMLSNDKKENLNISQSGTFKFKTLLENGVDYNVEVLSQPRSPSQICSVSGGQGKVINADVTDIKIDCVTYRTLTVVVTGLVSGNSIELSSGLEKIVAKENGSYLFGQQLHAGDTYSFSVTNGLNKPIQNCIPSKSDGLVGDTDEVILVNCEIGTFPLKAHIVGLRGTGLRLVNNDVDILEISTPRADELYSFRSPILSGSRFHVVVQAPPGNPVQKCRIENPTDTTIYDKSVTLEVVCITSTLSWFAGKMGGVGNLDGEAAIARFSGPRGIAFDSRGDLYVADVDNFEIRKITKDASGRISVSTVAGRTGYNVSADGQGGPDGVARLNSPYGIAINAQDEIFVSDTNSHIIRMITRDSIGNPVLKTIAGSNGVSGSDDGSGGPSGAARFNFPQGLAIDEKGNLIVADTGNNLIRKLVRDSVGNVTVSTIAGLAGIGGVGSADGSGGINGSARFNYPASVAVDSVGNIYVADSNNYTIRQISTDQNGNFVVSTLAGLAGVQGVKDGGSDIALFNSPAGIAIDSSSNLYITDYTGYTVRKITQLLQGGGKTVTVTTVGGVASSPGSADGKTGASGAGRLGMVWGIALDKLDNIFVADTSGHSIRKIVLSASGNVVSTYAATTAEAGSADGIGGVQSSARFSSPWGIAKDKSGNLYVADSANSLIRKITQDSMGNVVVTTLAGIANQQATVDGNGGDNGNAQFVYPWGIAVSSQGDVYVSDMSANVVRKIVQKANGQVIVSTLAGAAGEFGSIDGSGGAGGTARFGAISGIAVDINGIVYVADQSYSVIRQITEDAAGNITVSTLAGLAGDTGLQNGSGGPNGTARFRNPYDVATDNFGNIYVADTNNSLIRKITKDISGNVSVSTLGALGLVVYPNTVATDDDGNIFAVSGGFDSSIYKLTTDSLGNTTATLVCGTPSKRGLVLGNLPGYISSPAKTVIRGSSMYVITDNGVAVIDGLP